MQTIDSILLIVVGILLVTISSGRPRHTSLSRYELERRQKTGNTTASDELRREVLIEDVISIQQVAAALLVVLFVIFSVLSIGWLIGITVSVLMALGYARLGQFDLIHNISQRIYDSYEPKLLKFVERYPLVGRLVRTFNSEDVESRVSSVEELKHIVKSSTGVLSEDEKKLIISGLEFDSHQVSEIMTPHSVVDTIDEKELIGPLVLNDLHKTGHSRFPVTSGGIDHIVGVLHIHDLLTLRDQKSTSARKAMEPRVYYINQDQTLNHALAAFIKTRHHLFIVVNGYRETAGILTLEDVIERLIGRKIVDEFDVHDDLRTVAERSAGKNNNSPHGQDV